MQPVVYDFVEEKVGRHNIKGFILDVGSLDVNGSVEPLFDKLDCTYIGIDIIPGKNVDMLINSHNIPFRDEFFDCVTCCEMLEHDENPFLTIKEIHRVLKKDGWLILTVPTTSCPQHNRPDYWRFFCSGVELLLKDFDIKELKEQDSEYLVIAKK